MAFTKERNLARIQIEAGGTVEVFRRVVIKEDGEEVAERFMLTASVPTTSVQSQVVSLLAAVKAIVAEA